MLQEVTWVALGLLTQAQIVVKSASGGYSQACSGRGEGGSLNYFSYNPILGLGLHKNKKSYIRVHGLSN